MTTGVFQTLTHDKSVVWLHCAHLHHSINAHTQICSRWNRSQQDNTNTNNNTTNNNNSNTNNNSNNNNNSASEEHNDWTEMRSWGGTVGYFIQGGVHCHQKKNWSKLHVVVMSPVKRVATLLVGHTLHFHSCWHFTAAMSLARVHSSISRSTSISVSQEIGFLPRPAIHSSRTFMLICSGFSLHSWIMERSLAPSLSSRRSIPKFQKFVLICWGMLIHLSLPRNLISSGKVGWSPGC